MADSKAHLETMLLTDFFKQAPRKTTVIGGFRDKEKEGNKVDVQEERDGFTIPKAKL